MPDPPGRLAIGGVALGSGPRIVAAGGEAELDALVGATGAHLVELRADLFDDPEPAAVAAAGERLRAGGRPVILTARAGAEGGRPLDEARRHALYEAGLAHADAIDVEIASAALVADLVPRARTAGRMVILSAHFLAATPPAQVLASAVDRAFALGADIAKVTAFAREPADVRTLLGVTLAAQARGIVTTAMGPFGLLSRLLLPAAGSLFTYASVGRPTAPGQMPLAELAALVARLYPG
jgi:3-dehydroquinate dehydratase-1